MEFLLLKEISLSSAEHRTVKLSTQLERHMQECDRCRELFPEWVNKMAAWDQKWDA